MFRYRLNPVVSDVQALIKFAAEIEARVDADRIKFSHLLEEQVLRIREVRDACADLRDELKNLSSTEGRLTAHSR